MVGELITEIYIEPKKLVFLREEMESEKEKGVFSEEYGAEEPWRFSCSPRLGLLRERGFAD